MTVLLAVIAGGILAIAGGFLANRYVIKAQERKWEAEQTGLYNRETAKRLRKLYGGMVESATTIEAVTRQRSWVNNSDQTVENRDNRHARMLTDAQKQISKVGGQLMIEPAASEVRSRYVEMRKTFDDYLFKDNSGLTGGDHQTEIRNLEKKILDLADEVQSIAQQHLKQLDIPPSVTSTRKQSQRRGIRRNRS